MANSQNELFHYKMILSYKGSAYAGFQYQSVNQQTVQNQLQLVIADIINHQEYKMMAASRTDSGVHANGQVIKLSLPQNINPQKLTLGLNSKLPQDIKVVSSEFCAKDFNPNKDVISKEYHYYFSNNPKQNALIGETVLYLQADLDISLMQAGAKEFIGKHSFGGFCSSIEEGTNDIRQILKCSIEKTNFGPCSGDVYYLKICAKGFLKYMVRFIMQCLIDLGSGDITLKELKAALTNETGSWNKKKCAPTGLHLMNIEY